MAAMSFRILVLPCFMLLWFVRGRLLAESSPVIGWCGCLSRERGGNKRGSFLAGLIGGGGRESFQDGGAERPVGWKTIEAASLPHRVALFPLSRRQSLGPFTTSAAAVAQASATGRGLADSPRRKIEKLSRNALFNRSGLAAELG